MTTAPDTVSTADDLPLLISVDDHVIEPPHLFRDWLPAKFQDRAPHVERGRLASYTLQGGSFEVAIADGEEGTPADFWVYEDKRIPTRRTEAAAGTPAEEISLTGTTYDQMRPGFYEPKARLEDMDINSTDASLSFPTFSRFCGQTFLEAKDKELALACVEAYNDWMVEEWCGDSGGRLIPLTLIPLWDPQLAADEVRRNAARGVHAVCFSEGPHHLGLPTVHDQNRHWEPWLQACAETDTTICMHVISSSKLHTPSPDCPPGAAAAVQSNNSADALTDWLFSGVLARHPTLQIALSESQVGWIPYLLERSDKIWARHKNWASLPAELVEPPSFYYYRQVYGCLFDDEFGVESIEAVGEDNITMETDYPHLDSLWPDSREKIRQLVSGLTEEQTYKLLRGNAIRMLHLDRA